jgi:hypothetical protein
MIASELTIPAILLNRLVSVDIQKGELFPFWWETEHFLDD